MSLHSNALAVCCRVLCDGVICYSSFELCVSSPSLSILDSRLFFYALCRGVLFLLLLLLDFFPLFIAVVIYYYECRRCFFCADFVIVLVTDIIFVVVYDVVFCTFSILEMPPPSLCLFLILFMHLLLYFVYITLIMYLPRVLN